MDEWHDYFLAQAGAAGVLIGLVFVGASINLEKILAEQGSGLPGRAAEAMILLGAVLTVSSLMLLPGQSVLFAGIEVLVIGGVTWIWVLSIQLRLLRNWQTMKSLGLRLPFMLRVTLGQFATLPFMVAGIVMLGVGMAGLYWLAAGMGFSILVALFGAWVLMIEINR